MASNERGGSATQRLEAVLSASARIVRDHHGSELSALLHRGPHVARAEHRLRDFLRDLIAEGAAEGDVRDDVVPEELATYCLHALAAAGDLPSRAAVGRLVAFTLSGLRSPARPPGPGGLGPVGPMAGEGFEPSKAEPHGLQPRPFDRSGIPPERPRE
jgi:hypothetical protein